MKTLEKKLAETLEYYFNDTNKRSYNKNTGGCYYSGVTSGVKTKGCFVGSLLSSKDRITIDNYFADNTGNDSTVEGLCDLQEEIGVKLPKIITNNVCLMADFQMLHDENKNWNTDKGLTEKGKDELIKIIERNELEEKYFKKFLK